MTKLAAILERAQQHGGTSQEIADALGLSRPAVSAMLTGLFRAECVAREQVRRGTAGRREFRYVTKGVRYEQV